MTVVDKTAPSQSDAIAFEIELRHTPAKVWRAITDPVLLAEWLLPVVEGTLEKGAAFTLQGPVMPGWDGKVACRILESEPQKKLSYAWVVGFSLDTVVTFTLAPTDAGTRLTIVQSGFTPQQKQNWAGARYGWRTMGAKLVAVLDHADRSST